MNNFYSTVSLLILIMDPLGNLPVFISVLQHVKPNRYKVIMIRELVIALVLMLFFLLAGEKIFTFLNLRVETISVAGGIILFLISIKMIFPSVNVISDNFIVDREPFIVPLAVPLIAGPTIFTTLMLLAHQYPSEMEQLISSLLLAWASTCIILLHSSFFLRLLGEKGISALERIMGLILIMTATQMFLDGIRAWIKN